MLNQIADITWMKFLYVALTHVSHERAGSASRVLAYHVCTGFQERFLELQTGKGLQYLVDFFLLYLRGVRSNDISSWPFPD